LWDNACDGHRVYTDFWIELTKHSFKPKTQCGGRYTKRVSGWYNPEESEIRVCVEDWGPNTCSSWVRGTV
jgi:hypothetical protein